MDIAIQGEFGSFSHEAAIGMAPKATICPCALSAEVFERVRKEDIAAVIPIENSLAGSVVEHFDLLFHQEVRIEAESLLRIRHNLIGMPGSRLEEVRCVSSHPVALAQCRRFLSQHPEIRPIAAYDTAGSVKLVIENGDSTAAAIASRQAALVYGGQILAPDIEDNPANYTRFFLIRRASQAHPPADANKVSIAFILENSPGSLAAALQVFSNHQANLSKIESRPVQGHPWEYIFYADYQISHIGSADAILERLGRHCLAVKELGRYRAAGSPDISEPADQPPRN